MKRNDICINIPAVVTCECILHNVCEIHGESFNDAWLQVEGSMEFPQPSTSTRDGTSSRPKQVRDALMAYFCS